MVINLNPYLKLKLNIGIYIESQTKIVIKKDVDKSMSFFITILVLSV